MKTSDSKQSLEVFDTAKKKGTKRLGGTSEHDQDLMSQYTLNNSAKRINGTSKDGGRSTHKQDSVDTNMVYGSLASGGMGKMQTAERINMFNNQEKQQAFKSTGNFWLDCPIWCKLKCNYFYCDCRRSSKSKNLNAATSYSDSKNYSSGESDSEFVTLFGLLSTEEKVKRNLFLWKRVYEKSKGASRLLSKYLDITKKIKSYGQLSEKKRSSDEDIITIDQIHTAKCIINPNSRWKKIWDNIVAAWLVYVAIFIPFRVAFQDETTVAWIAFDCFVDAFFITDVFLTFFTAVERTNEQFEVKHKEIAKNYLKMWFWIDSLSSVPVQLLELPSIKRLIESNASSTKLLRLARLPRLYRIIRILRLVKMMRFAKKNKSLRNLTTFLDMTSGVTQMIGVVVTVVFLTHLAGCFWFLQAKLDDMEPNTWPVRKGLIDEGMMMQYSVAVYWAFQTLTTVGFGDVSAVTVGERIFAIVWMLLGVAMYSYAIGNMTNMIASMDYSNEELQKNLSILKELKSRTKMPTSLFQKIKRHLEKNQESNTNFSEQEKLLQDLPQVLRTQIISMTHGDIIEKLDFFKDKDEGFILQVIPELKPLKLNVGDILYQQKDHAEEIYMIQDGKIKLHVDINDFLAIDHQTIFKQDNIDDAVHVSEPRNMPFVAYCEGSYFGDSDIFVKSKSLLERDSTAIACQECYLFVMSRDFIFKIRSSHENEIREMQELAKKRKKKHEFLINQLAKKISTIQKEKEETGNTDGVDYELNLMMMDNFEIESSDYDSLQSDSEEESRTGGKLRRGLTRKKSVLDRKKSTLEESSKKKTEQLGTLQMAQQELNNRHQSYLIQHQETLTNFEDNIKILSAQSEHLTGVVDELNRGQVQQNISQSLKRLGQMVEQIRINNEVSVNCLDQVLEHQQK